MNKLLDLKIRELKLLNKNIEIINDVVYLKDKNKIVIGCDQCYAVTPKANKKGYEIPAGNLVNLYETHNNLNIPVEISSNCWLCPKCGRLFQELLPRYITGDINNVSL
jgi:hypothetical protein